jgi:hypothetical protein
MLQHNMMGLSTEDEVYSRDREERELELRSEA